MSDKKTLVPVGHIPGSKPLKVAKYERYARYRAQALSRIEAFRKIGNEATLDKTAHNNATRLEKRTGSGDELSPSHCLARVGSRQHTGSGQSGLSNVRFTPESGYRNWPVLSST